MKKTAITMMLAMAVGIMLTGCDKSEPESKGIDNNTIERLSRSADNIEYTMTDGYEWYLLDPKLGDEWQLQNLSDWIGLGFPLDKRLIFINGAVRTEVPTSINGPLPPGILWQLLCKETKETRKLYAGRKFEFNSETQTFKLSYNECKALIFTDTELTLEYNSTGCHADGSETYSRWILPYKGTRIQDLDKYALSFETNREAYQYIIDESRKAFGDSVNLNDYYKGNVILDDPWLVIDDVQKWLDDNANRSFMY